MEKYSLKAKNLSFQYNEKSVKILNNINFSLKSGEIIAIVGLSGSGKSTLINILNGTIPKRISGILEGTVFINNENIETQDLCSLATKIGTIFQDPDCQILFSCAEDELAFGPENLCYDPVYILNSLNSVSNILNIEHLRYRNPSNLSGGEKHLIALASVLTLNTGIIILDEVMSQIDENGKALIKEAIIKLKDKGKAILMVEHDLDNLDIADKIYSLHKGNLKDFNGEI